MERVKGIEASAQNTQVAENQDVPTDGNKGYTQLYAQIEGKYGRDLSHVVEAWAELPAPLKAMGSGFGVIPFSWVSHLLPEQRKQCFCVNNGWH